MKKEQLFSRAQLRELRAQFATISSANPDGAVFASFRRYVNGMPEPLRAQLAATNIRWISDICRGSFV